MLSRTSRPLQSGKKSQKNLSGAGDQGKKGGNPTRGEILRGAACALKITHIYVGTEHLSQELEAPGAGYGGYQLRFLPASNGGVTRGTTG